jgi:hypothetical protein
MVFLPAFGFSLASSSVMQHAGAHEQKQRTSQMTAEGAAQSLKCRTDRPKIIVVGGHTRNIGKTSVAAGLIRHFSFLSWTAIKITQYGHGVCSRDGKHCGCAPTEHPFALTEEKDAGGHSDTSRFLAAGAQRSLWLRVRQGQLGHALPILQQALSDAEYALVESNSILEFIHPSLYLMVLDSSRPDFKESARHFLQFADAFVTTSEPLVPEAWPGIDAESLHQKPLFRLSPRAFSSASLCRFVSRSLSLVAPNLPALKN